MHRGNAKKETNALRANGKGQTNSQEAAVMEDTRKDTRIVRAHRQPEKQEQARRMRQRMTPAEAVLWEHLRGSQVSGLHFRRQQVIAGFIADFYCHAARLVIECDGSAHAGREDYDADRDRILAAHGLHVLRVTNERIRADLPAVLAEILTYAPTPPP